MQLQVAIDWLIKHLTNSVFHVIRISEYTCLRSCSLEYCTGNNNDSPGMSINSAGVIDSNNTSSSNTNSILYIQVLDEDEPLFKISQLYHRMSKI